MIAGAALLVLANVATVLASRALLARVRTDRAAADFVLFLLLRLLLISGIVLTAGIARLLTREALGTVAAGVVLLCSFRKSLWKRPRVEVRELGALLGGVALVVALKLLLQVWFFSPHTSDVLSYHLPKVAEWVRSGGFGRELGVDNHATFSSGFELVETWWVLFLHHDVLIEMAGVEFLLLAFAGTLALARRLGLSGRDSFLAALVAVMTPGLALQATSCLNDGPAAALVIASFALLAEGAPLPLAALAAGLGMGVKATYGYSLPGLVLAGWWTRGERLGRRGRWPEVVLGVAGCLVGVYWYGRNLALFGSPIYPIGRADLPIQSSPSLSSLVGNFAALANTRIYDRGPYGAYLDGISGWGPVAFSCGIPGLAVWTFRESAPRKLALAFTLSLAGVFLLSREDDWFMRFCLFFPAILSIAAVHLLRTWPSVLPCFLVALGCQFLGTLLPYDLPLSDFRKLASQSWRARTAAGFFGVEVEDPVVGYLASNRGPAYCLYGPDYSRRVVYLRSRSPEEFLAEIKRSGLRTIAVATLAEPETKLVDECVKKGVLRRTGAHILEVP